MEERHFAAFAGIPCVADGRGLDEWLRRDYAQKSEAGSVVAEVSFAELEAVAERIIELSAIVAQNALVAIPEPVETMQPDPHYEPLPTQPELSAERKAQREQARARAAKQEGSLI